MVKASGIIPSIQKISINLAQRCGSMMATVWGDMHLFLMTTESSFSQNILKPLSYFCGQREKTNFHTSSLRSKVGLFQPTSLSAGNRFQGAQGKGRG